MKKLMMFAFVSLSLSSLAACSKKGSKCEQVYDHTLSLLPAEMKDKVAAGKDQAIAKCEKASPEAQQCALDAKSFEDLLKCPNK